MYFLKIFFAILPANLPFQVTIKNQKKISFKKLVYFCLAIFVLESVIYFSKVFYSPPTIFAQSQIESTSTSIMAASPKPSTLNPRTFTIPIPIFIYHYVENVTDQRDTIRKSLNIQPQTFDAQINTLKEAGYTFITPSEISKIERGEENIEKPIIISFDDGYRDFYDDVFPILKKNSVKAVAYIVPGFLDHLNYMYWNQVKEISQSNLIEIGAHSVHHLSLDRLSEKDAYDEIIDSKIVLELSLGRQITTFAYPYGHFTDQTIKLVKTAGFTSAFTTISGTNSNIDDKFTLKRIHPGTRIGEDLLKAIN